MSQPLSLRYNVRIRRRHPRSPGNTGFPPGPCAHDSDSRSSGSWFVASFPLRVTPGPVVSISKSQNPRAEALRGKAFPTRSRAGGQRPQSRLTLISYGPSLGGAPGPPSQKGPLSSASLCPQPAWLLFLAPRDRFASCLSPL